MPHVLHLIKPPVSAQALATIRRQSREPGTTLTVVLTQGVPALPLPDGVRILRLADQPPAPGALTYPQLLDLLFAADQVVSW